MKFQSNKRKIKIGLLIGLGVLVLAGAIFLIVSLIPEKEAETPTTIQGINLAVKPNKLEYYVGEEFDPTGAKIQVVMNKQSETYFVDYTKLTFSGFDSSTANDSVTITVGYRNYTTTFTVKVIERPAATPVLQSIRMCDDFQTTYSLNTWKTEGPDFYGKTVICTYSDGSEREIPFKYDYCYGLSLNITSTGTTSFTLKYSEGGVQIETTVTITITN